LGKTFVGTTLVALCTSLPELVASITALRLKAFDLVIGNVFGSNAFNMVLFFALDVVHAGPLFAAVSPWHAVTAMAVIVTSAIAVMGQLYQVEQRRRFGEPDALLMILVSVAALYLVYRLS
jgi:cation:H+ antiporter